MFRWIKSWVTPSHKGETISEILSDKKNRETLLGVLDQIAPSREQMERDSIHVINYSNSTDYSVFAKEAWSEIIKDIDELMNDELSDREIDFYRGKLSATVDLLRISYMARKAKDMFDQERKQELLNKQI